MCSAISGFQGSHLRSGAADLGSPVLARHVHLWGLATCSPALGRSQGTTFYRVRDFLGKAGTPQSRLLLWTSAP